MKQQRSRADDHIVRDDTVTFGVTLSTAPGPNAVDGYVELAREAAAAGVGSVWVAQMFDVDALTVAALIGREVLGIEVGTAVVPFHPRHPIVVANQALTAQAASRGRFTLGLGLSNPGIADAFFGVPWDRPILHMREHLVALRSIMTTAHAEVRGETLTAVTPMPVAVAGAETPPALLVGAVGPQALGVAGELAAGAITLHTGPDQLAETVVPPLRAGAKRADRPEPRLVAAVAAVVTDEPERVHAAAREAMSFYGDIPSWRAALGRQGLSNAADLAIIGDEGHVAAHLQPYLAAGATDITVIYSHVGGDDDRRRTWALLGDLERRAV
jgi:F420-dependent oxidoreductase-like protein